MYPYIGLMPDRIFFQHRALSPHGLHLLVAATLALTSPDLPAQSNLQLTLAETENLAIAAEPGRIALEAQASALNARAAVAAELPDPMLRIGMNNYPIESGGFQTEGMTNAGVGLRQVIPAGRTRSASSRQFEELSQEMSESAEARERTVLNSARSAWLSLYFWIQAHQLVSESQPYFDDLAAITRSLYAVGRKSQQDVLHAELELSRLQDRLIEIERQRAKARADLSEWIGADAGRPLAGRLPTWNEVPPIEALRASLQEHPVLKASDSRIAAREAGVFLAEQRGKPEWAVELGYSYREGLLPSGDPRSDFVSLNVTVGLPFLRRRSVDNTLTAALEERGAARATRERLLRELNARLDAEHARFRDLERRLDLYEHTILDQASDRAQAALLAYQSDRGDFADVMRAYIDDLNTRIDHVRLQTEHAQSYAVLANLGGLPR